MNNNKRWSGTLVWIGIAILVLFVLFLTFTIKVTPWYSWISVDVYSNEVDPEGLPLWRSIINPITHDFFMFPTHIQQKEFRDVTFQDEDGLAITADIGMDYKFDESLIGTLYKEYRASENRITNEYMRTWVKDSTNRASSKYKVDVLYWVDKEKFRQDILASLKKDLSAKWILVNNIYFVNTMSLPREVEDRIKMKIEATQKAMQVENELRTTEAEAQKVVAQAQWEADAIKIQANAMAEAIRIKAEAIQVQWGEDYIKLQWIDAWNGVLPTTSLSEWNWLIFNLK